MTPPLSFEMLALAASAALWVAIAIAWAVERGLLDAPLRKWRGLPFVRKVLVGVAFAAVVAWGAPKPPTGAPLRMAPAPVVEPVAVDAVAFALPTNLPPVTNLCFWGIERGPNSVALGLAWPPSLSLTNGCIDLFGHWRLATNGWAHLAQVDVSGAQSNAVVELPFADFPTNAMASTAFFRAADQADTDGDGLSDAF